MYELLNKDPLSLTEENIVNNKILLFDTWPFSLDYSKLNNLQQQAVYSVGIGKEKTLSMQIENTAKDLKDKQVLIVSWLLAAFVGVLGSFVVNLFFGTVHFGMYELWLAIPISAIALFAVYLMLRFLPLKLSFKVDFDPSSYSSIKYNELIGHLQFHELSVKTKKLVIDETTFGHLMLNYVNVVMLAMIRDHLVDKKSKILKIKVSKISSGTAKTTFLLSLDPPKYELTIDFKRSYMFWFPKVLLKTKPELNSLVNAIKSAETAMGGYWFDNSNEWERRGTAFLNTIADWDIEALIKKIELQIKI